MDKPRIVIGIGSSTYKLAGAADLADASAVMAGTQNPAAIQATNVVPGDASAPIQSAATPVQPPAAAPQPEGTPIQQPAEAEEGIIEILGGLLAGLIGGIGGLISDPYGTMLTWFGDDFLEYFKSNPEKADAALNLKPGTAAGLVSSGLLDQAAAGQAEAQANNVPPEVTKANAQQNLAKHEQEAAPAAPAATPTTDDIAASGLPSEPPLVTPSVPAEPAPGFSDQQEAAPSPATTPPVTPGMPAVSNAWSAPTPELQGVYDSQSPDNQAIIRKDWDAGTPSAAGLGVYGGLSPAHKKVVMDYQTRQK